MAVSDPTPERVKARRDRRVDDAIGRPDPCPQHGADAEACLAAVKRSIDANRDLPGVDYAADVA